MNTDTECDTLEVLYTCFKNSHIPRSAELSRIDFKLLPEHRPIANV